MIFFVSYFLLASLVKLSHLSVADIMQAQVLLNGSRIYTLIDIQNPLYSNPSHAWYKKYILIYLLRSLSLINDNIN